MKLSMFLLLVLFFTQTCLAEVVEFRIPAGTGQQSWNNENTPIKAKIGDSIVFINEDNISHQLHTYGAPCSHGPSFAAGTSWTCLASKPYSSVSSGPLYDHNFGEEAAVWIEVTE